MHLIDTNIFLEILLNQSNKSKAIAVFERIEQGEIQALVSSFSIHTLEVVLYNRGLIKELKTFLQIINSFDNLSIYQSSLKDEIETLKNIKTTKLDFDDCLHYTIAKKLNTPIITFDKHFKNIKDVKVIHP